MQSLILQSIHSPGACSGSAPADLLRVSAAAWLAAARSESGKIDPAPAPVLPPAPVNSGRSAIYGRTFGHPAETRSVNTIIPPIASRGRRSSPPNWTPMRAGKLPAIFAECADGGSFRGLCPGLARVSLSVRQPPVYYGAILESDFGMRDRIRGADPHKLRLSTPMGTAHVGTACVGTGASPVQAELNSAQTTELCPSWFVRIDMR